MNVDSHRLSAAQEPHLTYRGGRVLENPSFTSLYVGKYWQSEAGSKERAYLDRFGKTLVTSRYIDTLKQYGVKSASYAGSASLSATSTPTAVTQGDLEKLLRAGLSSREIPKGGAESVYTFMLPPGCTLVMKDGSTSREGIGGFHYSINIGGKPVYYAAIVHSDERNGIPFYRDPKDNVTVATSHEWSEVATDPDVARGQLGWYDDRYGEVSDIPINIARRLKDVTDRLDGFAVQKNWSEKDRGVTATPLSAG